MNQLIVYGCVPLALDERQFQSSAGTIRQKRYILKSSDFLSLEEKYVKIRYYLEYYICVHFGANKLHFTAA